MAQEDMDMEKKMREMAESQGIEYDEMSDSDRQDLMRKMQQGKE